jgi:hypothetical protein
MPARPTAFCACAMIEMYSTRSSIPSSSRGGGGISPRRFMMLNDRSVLGSSKS